ncbi:2-phospho-L-lactate transferase [Roseisalinus antarcticus]|uniref:2-phospho-L-lactate transferase n=1 Tax=Roseisalinus antarcticus TaxID=254357 RepID=A0A1Y5TRW5_9RHOB|nr:2-phospho-L-lactate transferase [Roseisalinus antarcticus]SLN70578.1 2-phospho-L-lactate transferase [Roseisalinus antarcticus]
MTFVNGASDMAGKVIAISGGVGGARLSAGLAECVAERDLSIIVNTGDDSHHFGLMVCPDLDSQMYMLAGLNDEDRGWGQRDESWRTMEMMRTLGEDVWFNLGDRDMGVNLARTVRLAGGARLTEITAGFAHSLGVDVRLLPMTDDPVSTRIRSDDRIYAFHEWFVQARCAPPAHEILFDGAEAARPTPEVLAALADPKLEAIIVAPSNPYLSIAPILAVPGMAEALRGAGVPIVGITPIVGGAAIKGPTADMLRTFGRPVTAAGVAAIHGDLFDGYLCDKRDPHEPDAWAALGITARQTDTMMVDLPARTRLARAALDLAAELKGAG